MLCRYFEAAAHVVHNSTGDADTMIVECALQFAIGGREVNVVADDTDVLVLLIYHWKQYMADIYFLSEAKKSQKKGLRVWKICDLVTKAGKVLASNLLFIHAWSGCDTTSATFGQGKTSLLKKIKESEELQQISTLISEPDITAEQIGKGGIRLFVVMYCGKREDSLNSLRYAKFIKNITRSPEAPTYRVSSAFS